MTSTAYRLVPWADVVDPHNDVKGGVLDMGTYAVNLANVFRGARAIPDVYARPDRFFARTYLTAALTQLLRDVLTVLAGGPGDRILQLRTPFGGGKTHTLVALLHLLRDRSACIGACPDLADLPDPGQAQVAVLSGEELDPLSPITASGVETRTLWGELAAQLGRYELVAAHDTAGSAPGGDTLRRVLGDGPVLVLLDEVLAYVEKAMAVERGESNLGRQAMLFMQALTEAAGSLPNAAMVYSLQASVGEAAGAEGLLAQLDHLVSRKDAKREPVSGDEVMRVVQTRLFDDLGSQAVRAEVAAVYADLVKRQLVAQTDGTDEARREAETEARQLEQRILASYPLHPALLDLMYHRWGSLPSYQRTRGALQFLASVTHALWRAGDDSPLIGPGEVDLADPATRSAFFSQVGERERYTSVIDADILTDGSGAKTVDRRVSADAPALARLQVGTRLATAVMLYSFGGREGEDKGVLEIDLVTATLVPALDRNIVVAALHDLREEALYLHHTGRRYRFEPTANLSKTVRDESAKFTGEEVLQAVRDELERALHGERGVVVWPSGPAEVPDQVPTFTFAYLHPDWSEERLPLERFVDEARGGRRRYRNGLGFVRPDGAQFNRARAVARTRLALDSLLRRKDQLGFTPEQLAELREKLQGAARELATLVPRAYALAAVPVRADDAPFAIEPPVSLRSLLANGASLHQRVKAALSHRVFDRITVAKLIELAGLGPDRLAVACDGLVDAFFSFFEFTKITGAPVIAEAISRAVLEGVAAYATGVEVDGDDIRVRDPRLVYLGRMLPVEEIDLGDGAFLLTPELAASLRAPVEPALPASAIAGGPEAQPPAAPSPGPAPGESIHRVALRARLDRSGLYGLNRALSWLREQGCTLDVEVTVRAAAPGDGIDPVRLRNGVIEPLEEGGADITQQELS